MTQVWFDITTSLGWNRPEVGITRCEKRVGQYLLTQPDLTLRFCRFDWPTKSFVEVGRDAAMLALADYVSHESKQAEPPAALEVRAVKFAKRMVAALPDHRVGQVKGFLNPRRRALHEVVAAGRSLRDGIRRAQQVLKEQRSSRHRHAKGISSSTPPAAPFSRDDVLLSMGLDWSEKDLGVVAALKQRIGFRCVWFCYDVIPATLPHLCVPDTAARFATYFLEVAAIADHIICISENTRRDLTQLLRKAGVSVPALSVVRLGCDLPVAHCPPSEAVLALTKTPYLLYVSTLEPRKNHEVLYRAYVALVERGVPNLPRLLFVGMRGWGVSDLVSDLQLDPRMQDKIVLYDHASDSDLVHFYKHCLFTVYPSLYEGWGLPVAESLGFGKYCLASNAASIPEVAGDLLEYIDPLSVQEWADAIMELATDPKALHTRQKKIQQHFVIDRWERAGGTVAQVLRSARLAST
jgi:glycosyltransferase involved in cell wall biosynthesis